MGKTYSGTYTNGIVLTNFAINNPVTVTGVIDGGPRDGLRGDVDAWTVSNSGLITSPGYAGVRLTVGGSVGNSGAIAGVVGVAIYGAAGSLSNSGSITGSINGVRLNAGGSVTNLAGG